MKIHVLTCVLTIALGATVQAQSPGASQYLANVNEQGVILDGYDAVALHNECALVQGSPDLTVHYQGADYWFCRQGNYERFKNNPARYAPQFGAYCAMSMSMGMLEPADVRTWSLVDGRLVVQRNAKAVGMWNQDPEMNLYKADQNLPTVLAEAGKATEYLRSVNGDGVMLEGYDPVALYNHKTLMKGLPQFVSYYEGGRYVFTSKTHQNTFASSPETFVPQFGGYCAMSMAMGMIEEADVTTWSYVDGRLVLQRNEKAVTMWEMNPSENEAKAHAHWPAVLKKENKKG